MRHFGSYQDFLRTIGYELDTRGFANIILEESNRQIAVYHLAESDGVVQCLRYTAVEMRRLVREAHGRRGQGPRPGKGERSYEDTLRAVGYRLGDEGFRRVEIIEAGPSFIVRENIGLTNQRIFTLQFGEIKAALGQMLGLRSG